MPTWAQAAMPDPEPPGRPALAWFGRWLATDLVELSTDPAVLDTAGRWAVRVDYEGNFLAARFRTWQRDPRPADLVALAGSWRGPRPAQWRSSLGRVAYQAGVSRVREHIARGEVYQANVTRVLTAPLPDPDHADVLALGLRLGLGNPAPYAGVLRLPGVAIACASPELFLARAGDRLRSRPIKGTGRTAADLREKDFAENVMIVDLVRNDLARVSIPGTVTVPELFAVEEHPGLVHLVSEVAGTLDPGASWPDILAATFPPGSVTGAPKIAACRIIEQVESRPRGPYCGGFGWVDATRRTARLAVAIRTFWLEGAAQARLAFGTGAGITWGSDPEGEWRETQLKAARLVALAADGGQRGGVRGDELDEGLG